MVSHQSATFGGRWHSGNEDLMFLLVVNVSLLFIFKEHAMSFSHIQNFRT